MYDASYLEALSIILVVILASCIWMTICLWKMFSKAGVPGWKAIIPCYNIYVMSNIVFGGSHYFIAIIVAGVISVIGEFKGIDMLVLVSNIMIIFLHIFLSIRMSKVFGKGIGFMIGMIFLQDIFWAILGFGKAEYIGPNKTVD